MENEENNINNDNKSKNGDNEDIKKEVINFIINYIKIYFYYRKKN